MSPRVRTDDKSSKRSTASTDAVRAQAARIVKIVFTVLATILALGAILVVLRSNINENNAIVKLITDIAEAVSGPFSRTNGIFDFSGKNAVPKNALLNWGLAAIVYLVLGRVISNLLAPKTTR
ncbi:hypothetical protein GCM10027596_27800 [Nocardioides korecus]